MKRVEYQIFEMAAKNRAADILKEMLGLSSPIYIKEREKIMREEQNLFKDYTLKEIQAFLEGWEINGYSFSADYSAEYFNKEYVLIDVFFHSKPVSNFVLRIKKEM